MTGNTQKKQLIHCEEMRDFAKWTRKEKKGASIYDCIGFYYPETTKKGKETGRWEVITIDGGYTANSQFEAETISSLEQVKALLLRKNDQTLQSFVRYCKMVADKF